MNDSRLSEFRNRNIGFVFQSFHLIPPLNVADNVALPLAYRHGVSGKERDEKVAEVLTRLGLSHRMRHFPGQLSGGQCQRVAIARAIIGDPQIVLADEPTGNLDSKMGQEVMEILHAPQQRGRAHDSDGDTQRKPGTHDRPHHPLLRRTSSRIIRSLICVLWSSVPSPMGEGCRI